MKKSANTSAVRASACSRACFPLLAAGLALLSTGCSLLRLTPRRDSVLVHQVAGGEFGRALQHLETNRATFYARQDEVLYALDSGLLAYYAGDDAVCRERLERAVRETERLITRSLSGEAGAWVVNDRLLDYRAMLHERRLIPFFSGLSALRQGDEDAARVEMRRMEIFLKELHSRYGSPLDAYGTQRTGPVTDSAAGRWLSMRLYEADGEPDEAEIDRRHLNALHQVFPSVVPHPFPVNPGKNLPLSPDHHRVSLLALSGRVPGKTPVTFYLHTEKDWLFMAAGEGADPLLQGRILPPIHYPGLEPGIHFKMQVPVLRDQASGAASVRFRVNDGEPQSARILEDTAAAVRTDWSAEFPRIVTRSALRALGKTLATHQTINYAKERVEGKSRLFFWRVLLTGLHSVSEQADVRMGSFFPARIHLHEVMLELGSHQIDVEYLDATGRVFFRDTRTIHVVADRINLLEFYSLR